MPLQTHPDLQIILYISGSGGLLERMAACNPDIMSIDQHVDMRDAIQRIGPKFAVQVGLLWNYLPQEPPSCSACRTVSWTVPLLLYLSPSD